MPTIVNGRVFYEGRLVLPNVEFFINMDANPWTGMFEYPYGRIDEGRWVVVDLNGYGKFDVKVVKCIVDPDGIPVAHFKGTGAFPKP
jgi:hypothetical protein